jgi:hypothetical protein
MTTVPSRKRRLQRNLGGTEGATDPRFEGFVDGPQSAELKTAIVLPERLLRAVLLSEIDRLSAKANVSECVRFFSHFFDPSIADTSERDSWVKDFQETQPKVVLGYPRTANSWPIFSITLAEEGEGETPIGRYVHETQHGERPPGGEDAIYEGGIWDCTWSVMTLAENPDQCLYLYHFAKLCLVGARGYLERSGISDIAFSGAELNPSEYQLPDLAFVRQLTVRGKVMQTVPILQTYRSADRLVLGGIYSDDVVVDGLRGGVHARVHGDQATNDDDD